MYQWLVKRQVRQGFRDISQGNFEAVLAKFAPDIHFSFVGEHAIGGDFHNRESVKRWFERVHRLFPSLQVIPRNIIVSGFPWDIHAITRFSIEETLPNGTPYRNQGVQILRIRRGRIVEDYLIEDNQLLVAALKQLVEAGITEASSTPLAS